MRNPTSCFITFLWSPLTVDLVLTKWGCSDRNNNLFGYLKSFTMLVKKNVSMPCEYQIYPKVIFNSDYFITCPRLFPWLIFTSWQRLLKPMVNKSHPALKHCRMVWCVCCVDFQNLFVTIKPQSLRFNEALKYCIIWLSL